MGQFSIGDPGQFCTGGYTSAHYVIGTAYGGGGIYREYLSNPQPIEQHAYGGEPLLDRWRRKSATYILDPGGDVHRFEVKQLDKAGLAAPVEKLAGGTVIGRYHSLNDGRRAGVDSP